MLHVVPICALAQFANWDLSLRTETYFSQFAHSLPRPKSQFANWQWFGNNGYMYVARIISPLLASFFSKLVFINVPARELVWFPNSDKLLLCQFPY